MASTVYIRTSEGRKYVIDNWTWTALKNSLRVYRRDDQVLSYLGGEQLTGLDLKAIAHVRRRRTMTGNIPPTSYTRLHGEL